MWYMGATAKVTSVYNGRHIERYESVRAAGIVWKPRVQRRKKAKGAVPHGFKRMQRPPNENAMKAEQQGTVIQGMVVHMFVLNKKNSPWHMHTAAISETEAQQKSW